MGEVLDQVRPCHLLQVQAWFAELDAIALHLPDVESLADEVVQPHAADGELASRRAGRKAGLFDGLALDERERLARLRAGWKEVPVALEALPANGPHRRDGLERSAFDRPDVDRDDGHA